MSLFWNEVPMLAICYPAPHPELILEKHNPFLNTLDDTVVGTYEHHLGCNCDLVIK